MDYDAITVGARVAGAVLATRLRQFGYRVWSEKTYRRTSTFAADLRPMTHAALQKRGLSSKAQRQIDYADTRG